MNSRCPARTRPVESDGVVVALPHTRAAGVLPDGALEDPSRLERLGTSPIVNLHVVYDRRVTDFDLAAGIRSPVQWLFDRTGESGLTDGQYLAVSLSGAEREAQLSRDELRERFLPALGELLPRARDARVERFEVVREHNATFRAAPGAGALRPSQRTGIPGLALAGAWTDDGVAGHDGGRGAKRPGGRPRGAQGRARPPSAWTVTASSRGARRGARGGRADAVRGPCGSPRAPRRANVIRTGVGRRAARRAAGQLGHVDGNVVALTGFAGGLSPELEPGDVVVATEVRGADEAVECAATELVASMLRRAGLRVHTGPDRLGPPHRLRSGARAPGGDRRASPSTWSRPGSRAAARAARGRSCGRCSTPATAAYTARSPP